jgi:ABC-type nitrate/sulfonate/bicarbonate transport system substrate-binding protein
MKIKNVLLLVGAIILALVFVAAGPSAAQEKKTVRIVIVSLAWNSELPFRAALVRGFFKSQGLQVEPILIRGGPAAIAALASGEADFASIGGAQAVFRSKARGLDLSIIGCISNTTNYILLGRKKHRRHRRRHLLRIRRARLSEEKQHRSGKRGRSAHDRRDGFAGGGIGEGDDCRSPFFH